MTRILVLGAGQIGCCVAYILSKNIGYEVFLADKFFSEFANKIIENSSINKEILDIDNAQMAADLCGKIKAQAICCCLPFQFNLKVAKLAFALGLHYFDLTEDRQSSELIRLQENKAGQVVVSQCGLAPGFVNMLVNNYAKQFSFLDLVELRVGALPKTADLPLNHALSWSVDGLINEYIKPAEHLLKGRIAEVDGLDNLMNIEIDQQPFEVFATSGGIGSLIAILQNKALNIEYKTIRHRGHCQNILFLLEKLNLKNNLPLLKEVLQYTMSTVDDDEVIIDLILEGKDLSGQNKQMRITKKYYNKMIGDYNWRSIQWTTAASMCAVVDLCFSDGFDFNDVFCQDQIGLKAFLANKFGQYFDS